MNLPAESALVMRRRSSWEAADSGILLWRDSFVYLIPLFALPVWTAAFVLRILPEYMQPWSYLILWWLKPLFDRLVLHTVAVRFFEPRSGIAVLVRGLGASLVRGLPGDLLWRRFNPWRSSRMPVRLLERLRGKTLRQRRMALERGGLDFCLLITVLGLALEAVLLGGELFFGGSMLNLIHPDLDLDFAKMELFVFAAYCFNYILVESLYVCMGFGLYINSRIEAEGWDLQLLFGNFVHRRSGPIPHKIKGGEASPLVTNLRFCTTPLSGGSTPATPPVLCLLLVFLLSSPPGRAEIADTPEKSAPEVYLFSPDREVPLEALETVLDAEDFGASRTSWSIRFKQTEKKEDRREIDLAAYGSWFKNLRNYLAHVLRALVVLLIAAGAAYSLYRLSRYRPALPLPGKGRARGLSSGPEEDPRRLLDRARELRLGGKEREAWASCLAGAMAAAAPRWEIAFPRNATEYDCLALVRSRTRLPSEAGLPVPGPEAAAFETLIRRWVSFAYAGRAPEPGAFEETLEFVRSLLDSGPGEGAARG